MGHDSHGIVRTLGYINQTKDGGLVPAARAKEERRCDETAELAPEVSIRVVAKRASGHSVRLARQRQP